MPYRRGKPIAILAGLSAFAIMLLGASFWKDIASRKHLVRLRSDPAYFLEALKQPDGILLNHALRKYVRERAGSEHLIGVFLDYFLKQSEEKLLGEVDRGILGLKNMEYHDEGP